MAEKKGEKMIGSYDIKVPEDTDVTLGYDMTSNKVKNFKFSGIWTWIVSKLKGESISDLNTTNKTVVGAIKEVNTPTFTTATSRANINSGESQSIIMGKIKKWLADLGTAAFCSVVNNLTTTAEGSVLDARQGKNLSDALTKLNTLMGNTDISAIGGGTLTGAINELNSKAPRGIITGTTTLEEYCSKNKKLPGEYRINGAIIPEISTTEKFWGVLILSAVFDTQIVIIAGGKMYIRDYTGNPNVWSGWKKYTYANLS